MFDAVTYGAAVGAAKKYTDEHGGGSSDAVKYTEQTLTSAQQAQARTNIGAAASTDIPTDAVKYTAQTLTDAQKTQARTNIGAGTSNFSGNYDDLDNAPDMTFIQPEISDMVDSGLGWRAQQAYYTDTAGNPQYYAQCLSYTDAYNGGYSLKINNGPSICAFIRDPNLIWGVYLLSTVESAAVINYTESRTSPVETISPVASNSWYIAGQIIDIGDYGPGKKRNYPDIVLPSDSTFRNADFGTDAATRAEAVRIILEAAHAIPPTSFNVPTVECTEQRYADAVKYTAQTLTDAQKTQARTNIGAGTSDFSGDYRNLTNAPPLVKGTGTGGNTVGGTGGTVMNEATKQNSMAYGYGVSAKGNYSAAFGYFLQALHDYEIAYGKFNQSNADTAFSIGDGTSNSDKHNLMELKTDGTLLLNGNAVKTEGGDDNKLRLGQICGLDTNHYFCIGFGKLMGATTTGVTFLSSVHTKEESIYLSYLFGDFLAYKATSTGDSMAYVAPIPGRREDAIKTGAWILIENCYEMFKDMTSSSFTSLDLSMFDTSKCKNMSRMFNYCKKLTSLDLSAFDTSMVTDMGAMFFGC